MNDVEKYEESILLSEKKKIEDKIKFMVKDLKKVGDKIKALRENAYNRNQAKIPFVVE